MAFLFSTCIILQLMTFAWRARILLLISLNEENNEQRTFTEKCLKAKFLRKRIVAPIHLPSPSKNIVPVKPCNHLYLPITLWKSVSPASYSRQTISAVGTPKRNANDGTLVSWRYNYVVVEWIFPINKPMDKMSWTIHQWIWTMKKLTHGSRWLTLGSFLSHNNVDEAKKRSVINQHSVTLPHVQ